MGTPGATYVLRVKGGDELLLSRIVDNTRVPIVGHVRVVRVGIVERQRSCPAARAAVVGRLSDGNQYERRHVYQMSLRHEEERQSEGSDE